jgi:hypothetical protein
MFMKQPRGLIAFSSIWVNVYETTKVIAFSSIWVNVYDTTKVIAFSSIGVNVYGTTKVITFSSIWVFMKVGQLRWMGNKLSTYVGC